MHIDCAIFLTNPHICLIWQSKKINTEAVNDYPPGVRSPVPTFTLNSLLSADSIRDSIRTEISDCRSLLFDPPCRNPVKSVPRGKAIWNANGGFVSVLLTHLFIIAPYKVA